MQRLQHAAQLGNQDAVAALQAYAQFKGQQGQPAQSTVPFNINGNNPVSNMTPEEIKNISWEDFTKALKININPETLQMNGYLTAIGTPPQTGRGDKGQFVRDAYQAAATKIAAEYGKTPEEMAAMPSKWKTDLGSLRVIQKQTDALEGVLNSFHNNLESWDKVARGLPPTFKSEFVV